MRSRPSVPVPGRTPARRSGSVRGQLIALFGMVGLLHLIGWGALLVLIAPQYPLMLGLGVLAYTLGLRHAFDADHISAIDNTTRKLLQQGDTPMGVGFYFSLGHSTVVFLLAVGLALTTHLVSSNVETLKTLGGVLGASVSGIFLYVIAILNLAVLVDLVRIFRDMRTRRYDEAQLEDRLMARGFMVRFMGPLFRFVSSSWQMYPIGFLFGLGFDTASEVSFLAISAGAGSQHLPLFAIVALPILFAAGMSLMDTADGAFMAQAYGWAFSNPVRKAYYNLTMTGLSVLVALFVGTIELLSVLAGLLQWRDGPGAALGSLDFNTMGIIIVVMFVVVWAGSLVLWKARRFEERWGSASGGSP